MHFSSDFFSIFFLKMCVHERERHFSSFNASNKMFFIHIVGAHSRAMLRAHACAANSEKVRAA